MTAAAAAKIAATIAAAAIIAAFPSALMQDQVAALNSTGVCADYLSSTRSAAERKHILDQLTPAAAATALEAPDVSSQLSLLYVTPELLATDR